MDLNTSQLCGPTVAQVFKFLLSVDFIGGPERYSIAEAPVAAVTLISSLRLLSLFFMLCFSPPLRL